MGRVRVNNVLPKLGEPAMLVLFTPNPARFRGGAVGIYRSLENNASYIYRKFFSLDCYLSPGLFQKAFKQLLV